MPLLQIESLHGFSTLELELHGFVERERTNVQNEPSGSLLGRFGAQCTKTFEMSLLVASSYYLVAKARKL